MLRFVERKTNSRSWKFRKRMRTALCWFGFGGARVRWALSMMKDLWVSSQKRPLTLSALPEPKKAQVLPSATILQKTSTPGPRTTIKDLKASGDLGQKVLTVKVVRKSNLCQNKTRTKFYFHLGVADETDAIKVVGFGSKQFEHIKEGNFYIIKDASLDRQEKVLKVTEKKMLSETGSLEVPRNVELKAEKLIFSPVYSIRDVQSFGDKTPVSVEGTVKEINQTKKDVQNFKLEDGTGSIKIKFWPEDTKHLDGMSNGDVVQINNLQTNHYEGRVSLNSTRTTKVQRAPVQNVNIKIIGIGKFNRNNAELDVQIKNQMKTLEVSSPLLAERVGLCLKDNFRAEFVKKLELKAKAQIQGNKINYLNVVA